MKITYEHPELEIHGSVKDLTQGLNFTLEEDQILGHDVPFGGDPSDDPTS